MNRLPLQSRTLALTAVVVALLALFIYVGLRTGPLAPVAVTVATVEERPVTPSLFGIGTVEARYTYKIGPTSAGRVKHLEVHVGDQVKSGQILGEMDPVDLEDRARSLESVSRRAQAVVSEAQARQAYAQAQMRRYEQLLAVRATSEETLATKRQELQISNAALTAAQQDLAKTRSDREGLITQKSNLRLIAPADGVVAAREVDPGTTIVAGQAVLEIIDPKSLWINVRFDQMSASGLIGELPSHIVLRSRAGQTLPGKVLRVEPKADVVTEELLAKVVFDSIPQPLPPVGELAEITVSLPALPATPIIPNAAVQRDGDKVGVWRIVDSDLSFTPVQLGVSDLDGNVQVVAGLSKDARIVIYSEKALTTKSRIHVVERIPGVSP